MTEAQLQSKIQKALVKRGAYCFKFHGSRYGKAGVPDVCGCYMGRFFGMEVKLPHRRNKVTELQQHNLKKIRKAGGFAQAISSVGQAMKILDEIEESID